MDEEKKHPTKLAQLYPQARLTKIRTVLALPPWRGLQEPQEAAREMNTMPYDAVEDTNADSFKEVSLAFRVERRVSHSGLHRSKC